jgi:hypothetical protein
MTVGLLDNSSTATHAEDASTNEVGFQSGTGEVEEKGQESESFHGPLAAAVTGAGIGAVEVAVVLVVVLSFEDESSQPANQQPSASHG